MNFALISIPNISINQLQNKEYVLNFIFHEDKPNEYFAEFILDNKKQFFILIDLFGIQLEEIHENVHKVNLLDSRLLSSDFLDEIYEDWINKSGRENTMDEYGTLLDIILPLKINKNIPKHFVLEY